MKKKYIIGLILLILIVIAGSWWFVNSNKKAETYSYEWVEVNESTIGQYRLYVNNSKNKHVYGKVRLTYLNDKSEVVEIPATGKLYIKSIIKKVSNAQGR